MLSCYRRGMKQPVDVILGMIAATATALLLADRGPRHRNAPRHDALIAASVMIAALAGIPSRERKE